MSISKPNQKPLNEPLHTPDNKKEKDQEGRQKASAATAPAAPGPLRRTFDINKTSAHWKPGSHC